MQRLSPSSVRSNCLCLLLAYVLIFSLLGPLETTRAGAGSGSPAGNAKHKPERGRFLFRASSVTLAFEGGYLVGSSGSCAAICSSCQNR